MYHIKGNRSRFSLSQFTRSNEWINAIVKSSNRSTKINSNVLREHLWKTVKWTNFFKTNLSKNIKGSCFLSLHGWRIKNLFKWKCNTKAGNVELLLNEEWHKAVISWTIISSSSIYLNRELNMAVALGRNLGVILFALLHLIITGVFPYCYLFTFFF